MRKVSKTMLAVVAAIQSGAHTRRKVKYIKEQALVSTLYPLSTVESVIINKAIIMRPRVSRPALEPATLRPATLKSIVLIDTSPSETRHLCKEQSQIKRASVQGVLLETIKRDIARVHAEKADNTSKALVTSISLEYVSVRVGSSDNASTSKAGVTAINLTRGI